MSSLSIQLRLRLWLLLPSSREDVIQGVLEDMSIIVQQALFVIGVRLFDDGYEAEVSESSSTYAILPHSSQVKGIVTTGNLVKAYLFISFR
jgi:hypothetical protein